MLDWKHLACVMLGGAIGAAGRYAIGILLKTSGFPWATFAINVVGCLAFGWAFAQLQARGALGGAWAVFLLAGVLGGFTTFSSFGFETITLIQRERAATAMLYAFASLGLGVAAVWVGLRLASTD